MTVIIGPIHPIDQTDVQENKEEIQNYADEDETLPRMS